MVIVELARFRKKIIEKVGEYRAGRFNELHFRLLLIKSPSISMARFEKSQRENQRRVSWN